MNGLVLGKFLPPHLGHVYLVEFARAYTSRVTVVVGTMQLLIGALRLGTIANFISPAALRGFMGGAAALIALYAIPDLLGLPAPTAHRLGNLAEHVWINLGRVAPAALGVGLFTIAAAIALRRWQPR